MDSLEVMSWTVNFSLLHHKLDSTFVCIKNNGAVLIKKSIKFLKISLPPFIFIATGWYYFSFFTVTISQYLSEWKNSSTSTVTNPTITNQTGFLFRDYTSYFSVKLRQNFLFAEKMPQFSFIWCDLILCLSSDLKGVDALNISIPDCLWTRDESVSKRRQKSLLVEGCQVTIQSSLCWCLLCVSSKKCTIGRQASSDIMYVFSL